MQLGSKRLTRWYKKKIIKLCNRAKTVGSKSGEHSFKSSNLVIPVLLFLFALSFMIGSFDCLLYLLVGWFISGCVSIPLILVIGSNYVANSSKADSRLNLFRDICIAWTDQNEFYIVRIGLFITSLVSIFILSLISTMMQKSIEWTLYKFSIIGVESSNQVNNNFEQGSGQLPSKQEVFNIYWHYMNEKQLSVDESYKLIEKWLTKDLGLTKDKIKERYNFRLSRESFPRLARNHMPY